eukprot:1036087-Amphidinium_carterae.1
MAGCCAVRTSRARCHSSTARFSIVVVIAFVAISTGQAWQEVAKIYIGDWSLDGDCESAKDLYQLVPRSAARGGKFRALCTAAVVGSADCRPLLSFTPWLGLNFAEFHESCLSHYLARREGGRD